MDQFNPTFGSMPNPDQQPDRSKVPPPPPSYDQQIGVRSMASDMQSIQQTGGESPKSNILSANDVFRPQQQEQAPFTPPSAPTPVQENANSFGNIPMPPGSEQGVIIEPPKKSPLKAILMTVGIVILAAAVGYGVYYLVMSLRSTPEVPSLPVVAPSNGAMTTPSPLAVTTPTPLAFAHVSLLTAPEKTEQIVLTAVTLNDFKTALVASSKEKLLVNTVKDLSFVTEEGDAVTSDQFLQSLFPSTSANLSFLFEPDFTAWLYADKTGGNKFGAILRVKEGIASQQLASSLALLEGNTAELGNMFIATVGAPEQTGGFKEGPIDAITVRYLSFSAKNQYVFEYAPVLIAGKTYVVIATSYYQMQHILKLLGAQPVPLQ